MDETFWRRHRAAIGLGLLGFALLEALLSFFVLFIAGMSHCSQCDMTPWVLRGFGFSFLLAALFGVAVGLGAAGLGRMLRPSLGARPTTVLLALLTIGLTVLAGQPGINAVQFLEYRVEKARDDALRAELRELCPDRPRHLAIIHDELPRPLPRDTFVAEVRFPDTNVTPLYQSGARAQVRRVIQGDPAVRELVVERVLADRCDKAFQNGTEGLVVAIPKDLPRENRQKVEAIFVRRGDGFRLRDGFQIQEWQRPYWLARPRPDVSSTPPGRSVTHAENGMASTSISGGEAIVVSTGPLANGSDALEAPRR